MNITRLNWAGIRISDDVTAIAIDPVFKVNEELFGKPKVERISISTCGTVDAVFVTHLHSDHFDPDAIRDAYGAHVPTYVPKSSVESARNCGLTAVFGVEAGESVSVGGLQITATDAVDGLGDPQCSWVVTDGNTTIFHGGDTLWHGYWWSIAAKYGPFDAVFLPVNGAIVEEPGLTPSGQPICMTPEQAIAASAVLQTKMLVPIHFQDFHNPPVYNETENCTTRLNVAARARNVPLSLYRSGETFVI
jgi:L-ascorbate metabolism protein UlaG (beta-lactamase superfamily)